LCRQILDNYRNGEINAVVIWDINEKDRNIILKFCYAHSIRVYVMPKISDVILVGSEELHVFDTPILLTREYSLSMEQRFIKRSIDVDLLVDPVGSDFTADASDSACHQAL